MSKELKGTFSLNRIGYTIKATIIGSQTVDYRKMYNMVIDEHLHGHCPWEIGETLLISEAEIHIIGKKLIDLTLK